MNNLGETSVSMVFSFWSHKFKESPARGVVKDNTKLRFAPALTTPLPELRRHLSGEKVWHEKVYEISAVFPGFQHRRGRKELKIMLIEAAWVIVRKDPAMMLRFQELRKRMNKNNAIIRIAKNMLSRIRHLLRNKIEYELGVIK